jgi:hypothetical protein
MQRHHARIAKPSHIVAAAHRYIGKETSRHWEQGDDMSLVDFKCMEYHNGQVIANKETREWIAKFGVRKIERETGVHHDVRQTDLWAIAHCNGHD